MKTAQVVIGANFGDEGKGAVTDFLCSQPRQLDAQTTVVRFNGGAQAGHTVVTPQGVRHVFHHFGSGTFARAATYLSSYFISNPLLFCQELAELEQKTQIQPVYQSPFSPITTHYDMMVNQAIELHRDKERHGSCGVGINETLVRHKHIPLSAIDLMDSSRIRAKLPALRDWAIVRAGQHGVTQEKFAEYSQLKYEEWDSMDDVFINACDLFRKKTTLIGETPTFAGHVVFEGAQGLLLDKDHSFFPHVTPSKTGLHNVVDLCLGSNIQALEVVYVTRVYMTRHGAGPFPTEVKGLWFRDITNKPHRFQQELRYGNLDTEDLANRIAEDYRLAWQYKPSLALAITHLDQVGPIARNRAVESIRAAVRPDRLILGEGDRRDQYN